MQDFREAAFRRARAARSEKAQRFLKEMELRTPGKRFTFDEFCAWSFNDRQIGRHRATQLIERRVGSLVA